MAATVTALLVGMVGPPALAALAFSLSVMAVASLVLSWLGARKTGITTGVKRARLFKQESSAIPVVVRSASSSWMSLGSVTFRSSSGVSGSLRTTPGGSTELVITPRLAGRSDNLAAVFEEVDLLGLFSYRKEVELGLVVESMPISMKTPADPLGVLPVSVGENPAGAIGSGQELFAVSEYQTGMDTRDILWKRAARMSDDRLPVRVREANVKKVVVVGLAVPWRSDAERAARVDLIAEALAQMGKGMLLIGTTMELDYAVSGRAASLRVSNLAQLADAIVGPWSALDASGSPASLRRIVDLLIMGPDDPEEVARETRLRPGRVMAVSDSPALGGLTSGTVVFTGKEDLRGLASEVIAR